MTWRLWRHFCFRHWLWRPCTRCFAEAVVARDKRERTTRLIERHIG